MRIKFIVLTLILSIETCFPNEQNGHFFLSLKDNNVSASAIVDSFYNWLNIDGNTVLKEIRNEIDGIGMLHQTYQQYYKDIPVNGCIVLVHSKDGIVQTVNGVIMKNTDDIEINTMGAVLKSSSTESTSKEIVSYIKNGKKIFRTCYKLEDFGNHRIMYVDIDTGDTIKSLSTIYHATSSEDEIIDGFTMYHGWQKIHCNFDANSFWLENSQIKTFYAGNNNKELEEVIQYRNDCESYASVTNKIGGILTSVKITSTSSDWWYAAITDTKPDLLIVIEDASGNELYRSSYVNDMMPPVIFNLDLTNVFPVVVGEGTVIKIYDYDPIGSNDYGGAVKISKIEPGTYTWSGEKTSGEIVISPNPAIDAHWGMEKTLEFYKTILKRNGYNNLGTYVYQFIDPYSVFGTHSYANACSWHDKNGVGCMLYGLGDNSMNPVVSLDVMAHEFTHMVTDFNGNGGLEYIGESGALNESFSDIIATSVEFYTLKENANWDIGEDVMKFATNMRNMKDPKNAGYIIREKLVQEMVEEYGLIDSTQLSYEEWNRINNIDYEKPLISQPDTYKGEYWCDTDDVSEENDHGGVHTNSGVQNYWFYLLSEGGSGENDNGDTYFVRGIGIDKAVQIAYRNLIFYLTPQATYEDAVDGSMSAAKDLYGESSPEQKSVYDAWRAVGLYNKKYDYLFPGVDDIPENRSITSYIENGTLYVLSETDTEVYVYDILGRLINTMSVKANEWGSMNVESLQIVTIKASNYVEKCIAR